MIGRKIYHILKYYVNTKIQKKIPLAWDNTSNFGDALNPMIFQKVTNKKIHSVPYNLQRKHFLGMGSILSKANEYSIICGSGFISEDAYVPKLINKVIALRGPLSKEKLTKKGIVCDPVYGDPGILLPCYYERSKKIRYKIGIIPHYVDKGDKQIDHYISNNQSVVEINILSNTKDLIQKITSCEYILSSSLHGLICAEAYGIPSTRLIASQKIIGGNFKFEDYRYGIGGQKFNTIDLTSNDSLNSQEIIDRSTLVDLSIKRKELGETLTQYLRAF